MCAYIPSSKEELKKKYSIANDDFEVLVQESPTPPARFSLVGAIVEPLPDLFGVRAFALKKGTLIIALILIPWWGPPAKKSFEDSTITTTEYYVGAFLELPPPKDQNDVRYVIATPPASATPILDFRTGSFPSGTQFHFVSGSANIHLLRSPTHSANGASRRG